MSYASPRLIVDFTVWRQSDVRHSSELMRVRIMSARNFIMFYQMFYSSFQACTTSIVFIAPNVRRHQSPEWTIFWATSIASLRKNLLDRPQVLPDSTPYAEQGRPGGLLQQLSGKAVKIFLVSVSSGFGATWPCLDRTIAETERCLVAHLNSSFSTWW